MADGRTGQVLAPSRAVPRPRPANLARAEPTVDRVLARTPLLPAVALAIVAAAIGRRRAREAAASRSMLLAAVVVVLAAWRPVVSAYRDRCYDARWSRQPLGW